MANLGADAALAMASAGTRAQDAIRAFSKEARLDFWWREAGNIRVSTTPAQDVKLQKYLSDAAACGATHAVRGLSREELNAYCASSAFRGGIFFTEGATVQPARLARALRIAAIEAGVKIYEDTAMLSFDAGSPCVVVTSKGKITARQIILATNVALGKQRMIARWLSVFSSYAAMSEPTDVLDRLNWTGHQGYADSRMFLHYFRRTDEGRLLMGAGAGPVAHANDWRSPPMTQDREAAGRAVRAMSMLIPEMAGTKVAKSWGGAIDMSSDRLPRVGSLVEGKVHYACGFCGHGVNPTYIAAACLSEVVLGRRGYWRGLPIYEREMEAFPPEPFRTLGARAIRRAIITCEDAEQAGKRAGIVPRSVAALPKLFGIKLGTR